MERDVVEIDMQDVIDAACDRQWDAAARALAVVATSVDVRAGGPWLAIELALCAAMFKVQRGEREASLSHLRGAVAVIDAGDLPYSPPSLVQGMEQAGVVACCAGELELGGQLLARGGAEIDRAFRAAPIGPLLRNTYHRGLVCKLSGRMEDAAPHIELAQRIADRVLARYPDHPETAAIHALARATTAEHCRELPFWFDVGEVPIRCQMAGPPSA